MTGSTTGSEVRENAIWRLCRRVLIAVILSYRRSRVLDRHIKTVRADAREIKRKALSGD